MLCDSCKFKVNEACKAPVPAYVYSYPGESHVEDIDIRTCSTYIEVTHRERQVKEAVEIVRKLWAGKF